MKYIIMLGDGMADYPIEQFGNKTPLQIAKKPNIDSLVPHSVLGMVKTVPDGFKPGSDVANLAVMGYDPKSCYTGRSPLEAVSIGINMKGSDVSLRCNTVTLSDEADYSNKTMLDYSAGEITTAESTELIKAVELELGNDILKFYPGISYRHCLIWDHGNIDLNLTPPHDISDKKITNYLPTNPMILELMEKSYKILINHPINLDRISRGLNPANSIWLWGEGTKPAVKNFKTMYGVNASVISAVDLIKGIGISASMKVIEVEGATGNIDTNFKGKGQAAINTLLKDGQDLVYIHCEAPDECGHHGDADGKKLAIELIDSEIVGPVIAAMDVAKQDYCMLVMPDHPTPIAIKTHTSEAIPFMLYRSDKVMESNLNTYTEESCNSTGIFVEQGYTIMNHMIKDIPFDKVEV